MLYRKTAKYPRRRNTPQGAWHETTYGPYVPTSSDYNIRLLRNAVLWAKLCRDSQEYRRLFHPRGYLLNRLVTCFHRCSALRCSSSRDADETTTQSHTIAPHTFSLQARSTSRANGCNCCVTSQLIVKFNDTPSLSPSRRTGRRWVSPRNPCNASIHSWNMKRAMSTECGSFNVVTDLPRLRLEEHIALHVRDVVTVGAEYSRQGDVTQLSQLPCEPRRRAFNEESYASEASKLLSLPDVKGYGCNAES